MELKILLSLLIIILISAIIAYYYSKIKGYRFLGNFWGALIIGVAGGILLNFSLTSTIKFFEQTFNINILAVFIGAYFFIKIFNKITP